VATKSAFELPIQARDGQLRVESVSSRSGTAVMRPIAGPGDSGGPPSERQQSAPDRSVTRPPARQGNDSTSAGTMWSEKRTGRRATTIRQRQQCSGNSHPAPPGGRQHPLQSGRDGPAHQMETQIALVCRSSRTSKISAWWREATMDHSL
jgi:hypothetical protein